MGNLQPATCVGDGRCRGRWDAHQYVSLQTDSGQSRAQRRVGRLVEQARRCHSGVHSSQPVGNSGSWGQLPLVDSGVASSSEDSNPGTMAQALMALLTTALLSLRTAVTFRRGKLQTGTTRTDIRSLKPKAATVEDSLVEGIHLLNLKQHRHPLAQPESAPLEETAWSEEAPIGDSNILNREAHSWTCQEGYVRQVSLPAYASIVLGAFRLASESR